MIWLNNVAVINIRSKQDESLGKVFQPAIFFSFGFNIVYHNKNMSILIKTKNILNYFKY